MTRSKYLRAAVLSVGVAGLLLLAGHEDRAAAQAADMSGKARQLKEADNKYVKALCDGSRSERNDAKATRARFQGELEKMIADAAAQAPDVQKALDAAADAGDAADKVAANPNASDRDKSEAQAKFQKTKGDLRSAIATERARLETQIGKDVGVKLAALDECPDQPKAAERTHKPARRASQAREETRRPARAIEREVPAQAHSVSPVGVGIGLGGIGISIGR